MPSPLFQNATYGLREPPRILLPHLNWVLWMDFLTNTSLQGGVAVFGIELYGLIADNDFPMHPMSSFTVIVIQ